MDTKTSFKRIAIAALGAAFLATAGSALSKEIAVSIENLTELERPADPVTFGMVFAQGDIAGPSIATEVATQADVKRRWPDGSVKHAVITADLPAVAAGDSIKLNLRSAPATDIPALEPNDVLGQLSDVLVNFKIHDGPQESVSLKKLAIEGKPYRSLWLVGSQVLEWHFKAAPVDADGKSDPDLEVRFEVRCYPQAKAARVAVIVENCRWSTPGNIPYDVQILIDGKEAYAKEKAGIFTVNGNNVKLKGEDIYIGHSYGARWVKRFWVPFGGSAARSLDAVHVRYDPAYLVSTGLLPSYDSAVVVSDKALDRMAAKWEDAARDILQNGFILPYFPATGGREDIGPLPTWTARYILSQDPRAREIVLGNGDLGASCYVHLRDEKTDWTISVDDYPTYSLNNAGSKFRKPLRDISETPWVMPRKSKFSVDAAHQASLAYIPYLITGDYFYLEEMQFWANWCIINDNYAYRQKEKAVLPFSMQTRGVAWALRQLIHAAALSPDGDQEERQAYFENKLANNFQFYRDFLDGKLEYKPSEIGVFTRAVSSAYGKTPEIKKKYRTTAGWMQNFLAWSFSHAVDHGYEEMIPVRDYFSKLCIGAFTHPDEITPFAGTAYYLPLAEQGEDGEVHAYTSWKQVAEAYGKMGLEPPSKVGYPGYGGSYSYIARGVLLDCARGNVAGAKEALVWLESQLPNLKKTLSSDPTWAFRGSQ